MNLKDFPFNEHTQVCKSATRFGSMYLKIKPSHAVEIINETCQNLSSIMQAFFNRQKEVQYCKIMTILMPCDMYYRAWHCPSYQISTVT